VLVDLLLVGRRRRRCEVTTACVRRFRRRKGGDFVVGTWTDAGQLKYVLDCLALLLRRMATLRNLRIVRFCQGVKRVVVIATICDPDVDNGNMRVMHAFCGEFDIDTRPALDIFVLQTLCLSKLPEWYWVKMLVAS